MALLQISKKGQILIPSRLRKRLGLKPGAAVQVVEEADHLIVRAVPEDPIAAAAGFLNVEASLTADLVQEHKNERHRQRKNRAG